MPDFDMASPGSLRRPQNSEIYGAWPGRGFLSVFLMSLFLALPAWLRGQADQFGPCRQPASWAQIRVVDSIPQHLERMLIVTNRADHNMEGRSVLFPNELGDYREVTYLWAACDRGSWMLAYAGDFLQGMKALDQGKDVLLLVHGHGKSMPLVLTRARQVQALYDVHLVVFDWPSYNSNFNKSLSRVRRCGENFYNLVLQMEQYRSDQMGEDQHLSLFMHSLGNYFLSHLVVNGNSQYINRPVFDNILLNAAAIRTREHGDVLSRLRMQKRLYVAYNQNDRILRGAHLLTSGRMLGNGPMEPLAKGVHYVDFTPLAGNEHTYFAGYHEFEFSHAAFREFYGRVLTGRTAGLEQSPHFTRTGDGAIYRARE